MQLTITEATDLAVRALTRAGMSAENARITADHLVDANLCGHEFSSLPRVIALAEALRDKPPAKATRVIRENHCSGAARRRRQRGLCGVDTRQSTKPSRSRARTAWLWCAANNTWFSGRLAYYVERAAREGFIAMHTTQHHRARGTRSVAWIG